MNTKEKLDSKKLVQDLETTIRELKNMHSKRANMLEKITHNNERLAKAPEVNIA